MPGIPVVIPGDVEVAGNVQLRGDVMVGDVNLGDALAAAQATLGQLEARIAQLEQAAAVTPTARADG